jgi:hypothetical protein
MILCLRETEREREIRLSGWSCRVTPSMMFMFVGLIGASRNLMFAVFGGGSSSFGKEMQIRPELGHHWYCRQ